MTTTFRPSSREDELPWLVRAAATAAICIPLVGVGMLGDVLGLRKSKWDEAKLTMLASATVKPATPRPPANSPPPVAPHP